jgi:hypothetical protein
MFVEEKAQAEYRREYFKGKILIDGENKGKEELLGELRKEVNMPCPDS